jgi:hypothetical protein
VLNFQYCYVHSIPWPAVRFQASVKNLEIKD